MHKHKAHLESKRPLELDKVVVDAVKVSPAVHPDQQPPDDAHPQEDEEAEEDGQVGVGGRDLLRELALSVGREGEVVEAELAHDELGGAQLGAVGISRFLYPQKKSTSKFK